MLQPKPLELLQYNNSNQINNHRKVRAQSLNSSAHKDLSQYSNSLNFDAQNLRYNNQIQKIQQEKKLKNNANNIFQNFSNNNPEDALVNFQHKGILHKNADRMLKLQKMQKNRRNVSIGSNGLQKHITQGSASTQRGSSNKKTLQNLSNGTDTTVKFNLSNLNSSSNKQQSVKNNNKGQKVNEQKKNLIMMNTHNGSMYESKELKKDNTEQDIQSPGQAIKTEEIQQQQDKNKKLKEFIINNQQQLEDAKKYIQFYRADKQSNSCFPPLSNNNSQMNSPVKVQNNTFVGNNNANSEDVSVPSEAAKFNYINNNVEGLDEAQNFCFTQNLDFLDNINISDPSIQQLFNDEVLSMSNLDLESFVERNAEYFQHILKNCACFKCKCQGCRCGYKSIKLPFSGQMKTTNRKQYKDTRSHSSYDCPSLNQQVYEQFQQKMLNQSRVLGSPLKQKTIQQHDFDQKELQEIYKHQQKRIAQHPFIGTSAYNNNFIDFKDYQKNIIKSGYVPTTLNGRMKLNSKTNYQRQLDDMSNKSMFEQNLQAGDVKKIQQHKTLTTTNTTDNKHSSYKNQFQGISNFEDHKIYARGKVKHDQGTLSVQTSSQQQQTDGKSQQNTVSSVQYKTTTQRDYQAKVDRTCHARNNNQQLVNYIRNLKLLKQYKKDSKPFTDKKMEKLITYGNK